MLPSTSNNNNDQQSGNRVSILEKSASPEAQLKQQKFIDQVAERVFQLLLNDARIERERIGGK